MMFTPQAVYVRRGTLVLQFVSILLTGIALGFSAALILLRAGV